MLACNSCACSPSAEGACVARAFYLIVCVMCLCNMNVVYMWNYWVRVYVGGASLIVHCLFPPLSLAS